MATLEDELNQADAAIGDGDTGGMLARVVRTMAAQDLDACPDLGAGFSILAKAALSGTGSSLGTLLATGLMSFAKETRGLQTLPWWELSPRLEQARDAMMARGGASLGDKTVLDGLSAVAIAVRGLEDPAEIALAAKAAGQAVLDEFRDRPCKIGRARMFSERSVGLDDPGMLSLVRLTQAVAE